MNYSALRKGLFAVCVTLGIFSCEKSTVYLPEDNSKPGVFGYENGKYAQQGRPFRIGYQCNLSAYAEDVTIEWKLDDAGEFVVGTLENNVSIVESQWEKSGKKNVVVRTSYRYGDQRKSVLDTLSLSVVPPVLDGFFFFDNKKVILDSHPDANVLDVDHHLSIITVSISEDETDTYILTNNSMNRASSKKTLKDLTDPYQYVYDLIDNNNPDYQSAPKFSVSPTYVSGIPSEDMYDIMSLGDKMDEGGILTQDEIDRINDYYTKGWLSISLDEIFDYGALQYEVSSLLTKLEGKDVFDVSYSL